MNTSVYTMVATLLLPISLCFAQINNAKTETVKIYGNCDMCKSTIEKAGNVKKTARVEWNKDTKIASLTYDGDKTNKDEILRRIALAGYDNDKYLAPDDVYAKLPGCCQYERVLKPSAKTQESVVEMKTGHNSRNHGGTEPVTTGTPQQESQLKAIFDNYFLVKDALVKSDGNTAAAKAKDLGSAISAVKMEGLTAGEHSVFMAVREDLSVDAEHISETKDVVHQRDHFAALSENIHKLINVSKPQTPVYYQHCPMFDKGKGANWLSKENAVKNPYYGSQMLTCGSTVETIK